MNYRYKNGLINIDDDLKDLIADDYSESSDSDLELVVDKVFIGSENRNISEKFNTYKLKVPSNFLIKNCNLAPVINPVVNEEQLEVPCNRHHIHGERPVAYKVVDSKGDIKTLVHWNTVKSPDLKSFKRWVVTGLIHALDSQIVDAIMAKLDWALDIHDAVICNPEDVWTVRKLYAKELTNIYNNLQSILNSYFKSIGIRATPAVQKEWSMIAKEVDTVETFNCSMWAMK
jgi:hypothetical protein